MLLNMGLVLTVSNGLHFLIAWELFALFGFFLITLDREQPEARAAATKVTNDAKDTTARETDARLKALGATLDAQAAEATQRIEAQRAEASKGLEAIAKDAADEIVARLLGRPATARG